LIFCCYLWYSFLFFPSVLPETQQKSRDKDGHLFRNHCWRELGLGMIANDPNMNMVEQMAFSRHNNPSSHIAYTFVLDTTLISRSRRLFQVR
jgi:hypothetical protein